MELPVWASAQGEHLFVCLIRNMAPPVNMFHQKGLSTGSQSELFNIYLDSAFR